MKKLLFILFLGQFTLLTENAFSAEQWTQMANFGGAARHRCTGFALGNKGYIGGGHINSGTVVTHEDYWQYDPSSDSWTQIADFGGGKRYHSTAFSIGDFAYVGLGEDDMDNYTNDFYRYSAEFNIWQPIANFPGNARRGASGFAIDGFGYVGLGQSNLGYHTNFFRYNPQTNTWSGIADFIGEARSSAVAFSHNGIGYVGTGHIFGDDTKDFYAYNPALNSWTQKADVGTTNRQDATGFAVNGKGYIGTGNDVDAIYNFEDFWEYDFATDTWTQFNDFSGAGRRYMVSFVISGRAYAGTGTDGTNMRDFWVFDPLLSQDKNGLVEINVYPNPSFESIHFSTGGKIFDLKIYDLQGSLVYQKSTIANDVVVQKSELCVGQFVYVMTEKGKVISTGKIQFLE